MSRQSIKQFSHAVQLSNPLNGNIIAQGVRACWAGGTKYRPKKKTSLAAVAFLFGASSLASAADERASQPVQVESTAQSGQAKYPEFTCYAGLPMTIKDESLFIGRLVAYPGCEISLSNDLHARSVAGRDPVTISLTVNSLELHGLATLHLEDAQGKADDRHGVPAEPRQSDGKTVKGGTGAKGYGGIDGKPSVGINLTILSFAQDSSGSLWVRTDGQSGGAGGEGGKGGKGSAGPFTGFSCPNGGDGGTGGEGGQGGVGADTSRVMMRILGVLQPAQRAVQPFAPSFAPPSVLPGTDNVVVASGAPGRGGKGGTVGAGGVPGEGHPKCGPFTGHANEGNHGENGAPGKSGRDGSVVI